jgi:hypothetical protein
MALVVEAIQQFCRDHDVDEFRQVDVRGISHPSVAKSSTQANAFNQLRTAGYLRLARQEGNNKYFRLTRKPLDEALALSRAGEVVS